MPTETTTDDGSRISLTGSLEYAEGVNENTEEDDGITSDGDPIANAKMTVDKSIDAKLIGDRLETSDVTLTTTTNTDSLGFYVIIVIGGSKDHTISIEDADGNDLGKIVISISADNEVTDVDTSDAPDVVASEPSVEVLVEAGGNDGGSGGSGSSDISACQNGAGADDDPSREDACQMFQYVNDDRALFDDESNNAAPLTWAEDLWEVAVAHSRDMCENSYFAHTNQQGKSPFERCSDAGTSCGGENIVYNFSIAASQYAFMHEPTCTGHRGNILNPGYGRVGIGTWLCDGAGQNGALYSTQVFDWEDYSASEYDYCATNASTYCQVPPEPVSSAGEDCAGCELDTDMVDSSNPNNQLHYCE